jgi:hypothetical protein
LTISLMFDGSSSVTRPMTDAAPTTTPTNSTSTAIASAVTAAT